MDFFPLEQLANGLWTLSVIWRIPRFGNLVDVIITVKKVVTVSIDKFLLCEIELLRNDPESERGDSSVLQIIKEAFERSPSRPLRSEEHTSELQSRQYLVCRLLLEKTKK